MDRLLSSRTGFVLALACIFLGCIDDDRQRKNAISEAVMSSSFEHRLLEVAQTYKSYGRLDPAARWGTPLCLPIGGGPRTISPRFSESKDSGTHGQKLYSLFVKEASAYGDAILKDKPSPIGQVVVKESWIPEEVTDKRKPFETIRRKVLVHGEEQTDVFLPYAGKDGRLYQAKGRGPLFIIWKVDTETPGTDEGWVYGTVTADARKVMSVGQIESCIGCHRKAPHERLFGLPNE